MTCQYDINDTDDILDCLTIYRENNLPYCIENELGMSFALTLNLLMPFNV